METINTPLTKMLGIKYPVVLAGMNGVAGPELAAAVTNAGGLGIIGGVGYTPKFLREAIKELKEELGDPNAPFGVDLLLPQVGGSARKTNYDYTDGKLPELIDIVVESGAALFVSAVGVPPIWAVEKLHAAGIPVMNMIGSVRHVKKALAVGVDIICAQGTEGGGHTGDTATTVLIPQVADLCRQATAPINGGPVLCVAAGGIFDGRGLAMSLALGASGVWVGTRFIASEEAGCAPRHTQACIDNSSESTIRTIIFTGRPLRVIKNDYIMNWELHKQQEIAELTSKGILPAQHDIGQKTEAGEEVDMEQVIPLLMGQACGAVTEVLPAKIIVDNMVKDAIQIMSANKGMIGTFSGTAVTAKL
jgi:NAD(P)H-dependent flavin oxidoreductase YrpB (nitropropane dioxygenase family)